MKEKYCQKIQNRLRSLRANALLVAQPENRRYLSGYTSTDTSINESSGFLLIPSKGKCYLLTDSRYDLQARQEVSSFFDVVVYQKGFFPCLLDLLQSLSIQKLILEANYTLVSFYNQIQEQCSRHGIEISTISLFIEKLRLQKSGDEISLIEKSVQLNEQVFQKVYKNLQPGMREIDIALLLENTMRQSGAERPSFATIVASGPNAALPHAIPTERKVKTGEPVIIDMGLVLNGYCSDMTRTVFLGTPSSQLVNISRIVRKAQLKAANTIRPGISCASVDRAARRYIKDKGYGEHFGHGLGHGVGLAVHEGPSLNARNRKHLREGMVVTIEPGIYIEGWGGVRLENMYVITKDGGRLLNHDQTCLDV